MLGTNLTTMLAIPIQTIIPEKTVVWLVLFSDTFLSLPFNFSVRRVKSLIQLKASTSDLFIDVLSYTTCLPSHV